MPDSDNIPLPTLYSKGLDIISKVVNIPLSLEEKKELVSESLKNLKTVHSRIISLSLFSPNETVEDISTKDLVYLSLPFVLAEAQSRVQLDSRSERLESLAQVERYLKSLVSVLETYEIVPQDEKELYGKPASAVRDPAKKRELKINQYKKEKDLKTRIQTLRKKRSQAATTDDLSVFELISSLLPTPQEESETVEPNAETDEILRETILILLRLLYAQARGQLDSLSQEVELLKMAPPSPKLETARAEQDSRLRAREEEASMWRLDAPRPTGGPDGKGPLLDSSGKVLRPFTLLPSDAGERQRLQAEVFRPDHRLPTMTIDEMLEIEAARGKFISGGGPGSENQPTSSEQLAIDAEMDGTLEAEEKAEQKRQKDEKWARFTDENPRGAGNTMNRG